MAMNIQERQLIADIRRLNPAGQDELLQQLDRIKRNSPVKKAQQPSQRINASLPQKNEKRPEAANEPLFTE